MIEKKGYTVNDDSTLLKFGNAFQSKIIALLLTKKSFIQTISDILKPKFFDSAWLLIDRLVNFFSWTCLENYKRFIQH